MKYDPNKEEPMLVRLQRGEAVQCEECGEGIFRPFNADYKKAHGFRCDNCGLVYHWDPLVIIE